MSAANRQTQARFECVACGFEENADLVGAINITCQRCMIKLRWVAFMGGRDDDGSGSRCHARSHRPHCLRPALPE
ncbi:hypothetical protein BXU06_09025 [Aquaspirillum sp. LM1]|uniref:zinc ribbon domain-containing protein n=1 Tax=Aquaspirillum sp. LM1 TaxID=1938604 RepID=UPI000983AED5|nr:zinc ribbon domain-containing protein [Aquaspirillum sp. LM1]AQR65186.1 hypothetical protein BXU06_09025 [Aquaspirillum sp. LM1]